MPGRQASDALTYLQRLSLTDFRNHAWLDLSLEGRPVCVVGPNGVGKTNILEAIAQLVPGRSLRGADLEAMGRRLPEETTHRPWTVFAEIYAQDESHRLGVGIETATDAPTKRTIRLNGRPASGAELMPLLRVIWLTPDLDRLFAESKGTRRRFLDRLVYARTPSHGPMAARFERGLRERQKLLDDGRLDDTWIEGLELGIAESGVAMAAARLETIAGLQAEIDHARDTLFPRAQLAITGFVEELLLSGLALGAAEEAFRLQLLRVRRRDAAAGRALDGPHRSEFTAVHIASNRPAEECSTGEQKALVIGVVLAQARALSRLPGAKPLLLLDEATSHLDAQRRAALAAEVSQLPGQAWLTGVEASVFRDLDGRAQFVSL